MTTPVTSPLLRLHPTQEGTIFPFMQTSCGATNPACQPPTKWHLLVPATAPKCSSEGRNKMSPCAEPNLFPSLMKTTTEPAAPLQSWVFLLKKNLLIASWTIWKNAQQQLCHTEQLLCAVIIQRKPYDPEALILGWHTKLLNTPQYA